MPLSQNLRRLLFGDTNTSWLSPTPNPFVSSVRAGELRDLDLSFLPHFSTLGCLLPGKGRCLEHAKLISPWDWHSSLSTYGATWMPAYIWKELGNLFPHILPKFIVWNKLLRCSNNQFCCSYHTKGYKVPSEFSLNEGTSQTHDFSISLLHVTNVRQKNNYGFGCGC